MYTADLSVRSLLFFLSRDRFIAMSTASICKRKCAAALYMFSENVNTIIYFYRCVILYACWGGLFSCRVRVYDLAPTKRVSRTVLHYIICPPPTVGETINSNFISLLQGTNYNIMRTDGGQIISDSSCFISRAIDYFIFGPRMSQIITRGSAVTLHVPHWIEFQTVHFIQWIESDMFFLTCFNWITQW